MRTQKPLIIANTKSYIRNLKDFYKLQDKIWQLLDKDSYTYMCAVPSALITSIANEEYKAFSVGSQGFETYENGAFTGQNTLENIIEAGAAFVIVGHSEERKFLAEGDDIVNLKVKKSLSKNFRTVLCVGENQRNNEDYFEVIKNSLYLDLQDINKKNLDKLVIAYEPLWAIGAVTPATSEQAQETIILIRRTLVEMYGIDNAKKIKVIYGGAVSEENASKFINEATADGVLVGRACMDADRFASIVNDLYR